MAAFGAVPAAAAGAAAGASCAVEAAACGAAVWASTEPESATPATSREAIRSLRIMMSSLGRLRYREPGRNPATRVARRGPTMRRRWHTTAECNTRFPARYAHGILTFAALDYARKYLRSGQTG